jgi:DNA modification methylase
MGDEKAEILFPSPPYSDMRTYAEGTDVSISKLINFIKAFSKIATYQIINLGIQRKNNEVVQYWDDYIKTAKEAGYKLLSWNVWVKPNAGSIAGQTAMFPIMHEWLFVFGSTIKQLNATIENTNAGVLKRRHYRTKEGDILNGEFRAVKDRRPIGSVTDVCQEVRHKENAAHPAVFPIDLPFQYIEAMTAGNDIVVDPFLGSGTTMIACENLGRKCRGCEISPEYVAVILERFKTTFPGKEIKLVTE